MGGQETLGKRTLDFHVGVSPDDCLPYLLTIYFWGRCCLHCLRSESWQWFAEWEEDCSAKRLFCPAEYQCLLSYCRLHHLGGGKAARCSTNTREPFCAGLCSFEEHNWGQSEMDATHSWGSLALQEVVFTLSTALRQYMHLSGFRI